MFLGGDLVSNTGWAGSIPAASATTTSEVTTMTVADDTPTRADLIEKLGHLVSEARRVDGTAYYDRRHAQINDVLDDLQWIDTGQVPASLTM